MFICNHFGWNETNILGVERTPRYHDYIWIYMFQYLIDMMCDNWIICSYVTILVEIKPKVLEIERKSRYHGYICIYILQYDWIDMICDMPEWWVHTQFIWLKWNSSIGDWKEIKVPVLHMNLCAFNMTTEMKLVWVKWSMYDRN